MSDSTRKPLFTMALMFIAVQLIAISVTPLYEASGMKAFEDEDNIWNPICYIVMIIVFTFLILFIIKKGRKNLINYILLGAVFITISYVVYPFFNEAMGYNPEDSEWKVRDFGYITDIDFLDLNSDGMDEIVLVRNNRTIIILDEGFNVLAKYDALTENDYINDGEAEPAPFPPWNSSGNRIYDMWTIQGTKYAYIYYIDSTGTYYRGFKLDPANGTYPTLEDLKFGMKKTGKNSSAYIGEAYYPNLKTFARSYWGNLTSSLHIVNYTQIVDAPQAPHFMPGHATFVDNVGPSMAVAWNKFIMHTGDELLLYKKEPPRNEDTNGTLVRTVDFEDMLGMEIVPKGLKFDKGKGSLVAWNSSKIVVYDEDLNKLWSAKHARIKDVEAANLWGTDIPELVVRTGNRIQIYNGEELQARWDLDVDVGFIDSGGSGIAIGETDGDPDTKVLMLGTGNGINYERIEEGEYRLITPPKILALVVAILLTFALMKWPEWYVVDSVGIMVAAGAASLFGLSFSILPTIILLSILLIYDAISVYKTKHMVDLADNVVEMHLPLLVVVPKDKDYSFKEQGSIKEQIDKGEEREAMFMGLGDLIVPSILVVSSYRYLAQNEWMFGLTTNMIVALAVSIGILCGYGVLSYYVAKGKPQAGLPFLNSGAMAGYFIAVVILYGNVGF